MTRRHGEICIGERTFIERYDSLRSDFVGKTIQVVRTEDPED